MRKHLRQVHTDLNASLAEAVTGQTPPGWPPVNAALTSELGEE
jgi:hypothetical protein